MVRRVAGWRVRAAPWVVLFGTLAHGCAYVSSTMPLAPMMTPPPVPQFKPTVEQTVGNFAYAVGDTKMITSNVQGMQLNTDILGSWKQSGYIAGERYVENGAFTRGADYDVTLNGSQYGESHIVMQVLSYLTLFLVPYSVTQNYDLQYAVQDSASGQLYSASVQTTRRSTSSCSCSSRCRGPYEITTPTWRSSATTYTSSCATKALSRNPAKTQTTDEHG